MSAPLDPAARAAAAQEQAREMHAKVNIPVGDQSKLPRPERPRTAFVDLEREQSITVHYSTVTFKPNQAIKDARLLKIAEENGIPLRYKD